MKLPMGVFDAAVPRRHCHTPPLEDKNRAYDLVSDVSVFAFAT